MFRNIYLVKSLAFLGLLGFSSLIATLLILTVMATPSGDVYSVWALPPEAVGSRVKKLMEGLRADFGGPHFEPHITVVGAIRLSAGDAVAKFRSACEGLRAYNATVDRVATGTFFYQCVYLLIHPTPQVTAQSTHLRWLSDPLSELNRDMFLFFIFQVVEASSHCSGHFGYNSSTRKCFLLSFLQLLSLGRKQRLVLNQWQ